MTKKAEDKGGKSAYEKISKKKKKIGKEKWVGLCLTSGKKYKKTREISNFVISII